MIEPAAIAVVIRCAPRPIGIASARQNRHRPIDTTPSDMRMLAEPAVLMSAPKIRMRAGINNSPPATPRMLLTSPTPIPMLAPAAVRRQGFRDNGLGKLREALAHRVGEVR